MVLLCGCTTKGNQVMIIDQNIINELARIAKNIDDDNVREHEARYLWNLIKQAERDLAPGFSEGKDPVTMLPENIQAMMSGADIHKFQGHIKAKDSIAAIKIIRNVANLTLGEAKDMVDVILPSTLFCVGNHAIIDELPKGD